MSGVMSARCKGVATGERVRTLLFGDIMSKSGYWHRVKLNCDDCGELGVHLVKRANGTTDKLCFDCASQRSKEKHKIQQEAYRKGRKMAQANGNKCQQCGKVCEKSELDCHHITPLSLGGTNDDDNLMLLCRECHKKVHYSGN